MRNYYYNYKIVKFHMNAYGQNKTKGLFLHGNVSCATGTAKNHTYVG